MLFKPKILNYLATLDSAQSLCAKADLERGGMSVHGRNRGQAVAKRPPERIKSPFCRTPVVIPTISGSLLMNNLASLGCDNNKANNAPGSNDGEQCISHFPTAA